MGNEWYIGSITVELSPNSGSRNSKINLAVKITKDEHDELCEAANAVRMTSQGVLFRLVFVNHQMLQNLYDQLLSLLTSDEQRSANWDEAYIQLQFVFANWLGSVRWLLDHTKTRLHVEPEKLEQYEASTRREFDSHFAYRLTYKLRDYTTHCNLPPLFVHSKSKRDRSGGRIDRLEIHLRPDDLLNSWNGWGESVKRDLQALSEPIDLMSLVDEAMGCIERVMLRIVAVDIHKHRASAQKVVDAVERLPDEERQAGGVPMLFVVEGDSTSSYRSTLLPVDDALNMLNPPREPTSDPATA